MRTTTISLVLFFLVAGLPPCFGQDAPTTGAAMEEGLLVPPTQAAQGLSLALGAESRESRISGGVGVTAMYTDNVFLTVNAHQWDVSYQVRPYVAWDQFTSRTSLRLAGGAGFVAYQRVNERNQADEDFSVDLGYLLRPHLRLRVDDAFVNTTGLFSGVSSNTQAGIGVVQQANSTLITPASHILRNTSLGELTYQFSPQSNLGFRGVVSILRYPGGAESVSNIPLFEGQSYSVETFYNHRFSVRQWLGVTLRAQRFDSQSSQARTDAGSALFFYSLVPTQSVTISLFAGPQLAATYVTPSLASTTGPLDHHDLNPATGATLSWQKRRTIADVSFIRQASDGGGLYSAVTNETVEAGLRRALTDRQQVMFTFTYARNHTLASDVNLSAYSGQAEFTRRLAGNLNGALGYRFDQQEVAATKNLARANRVWISLSYDFSKPLGR